MLQRKLVNTYGPSVVVYFHGSDIEIQQAPVTKRHKSRGPVARRGKGKTKRW